jgi:hypothetical protein
VTPFYLGYEEMEGNSPGCLGRYLPLTWLIWPWGPLWIVMERYPRSLGSEARQSHSSPNDGDMFWEMCG